MKPRRGVLALSGYGLRIAVERGHLIVQDGAGRTRRHGRFSRVSPELKRIVIVGSSGTVTLDALRWLTDTGAHVVQVDHDGQLVAVTATARLDDARLRRAQASATKSGLGLELARELIAAKIDGQASTLAEVSGAEQVTDALREACSHVRSARTIDRVRYVEARAASAYWHALVSVELRFPSKHLARVPTHWRTLGDRHSPLTSSARRGVSPLNAMLNYCYGIAAAEARIACIAAGCDPGLGIVHADKQGRDSLVFDVLEPVRPHVDAYVFRLAREHTFASSDFFENRKGECRIMPPLTRQLSETASRWGQLVQPIAHGLARRFERAGASAVGSLPAISRELPADNPQSRLPLLLRSRQLTQQARAPQAREQHRCRRCGANLAIKRRKYCPDCISSLPAMASDYARLALKRRQRSENGAGPSAETRQLMGDARSRRAAEIRAWEAAHPVIPASHVFTHSILPTLEGVPAQEVRDATALSISYCRRVLRGQFIPHPMHWDAIRALSRTRMTRGAEK